MKASLKILSPCLSVIFVLGILFCWASRVQAQCNGLTFTVAPTQSLYCGNPSTVIINNTSTGVEAPTTRFRYFRNGTQIAQVIGTGTITDPGLSPGTYNYAVAARAFTPLCRDTVFFTVIVEEQPVANFNFAPNNACAGTTINFSSTSTGTVGGATYAWNFGDGNTGSGQNTSHAYAPTGGTFNVTLTVTNPNGCTDNIVIPVTALPAPVAAIQGFDGDGDSIYCLLPADPATTDTLTFTNTTTGAISYTWDYGDGSGTVTTASNAPLQHVYTAFGTYTVTMTATSANGCTSTATLTIIFERRPVSSVAITPAENGGCLPHIVCPANNGENATTYIWDFGDGTGTVTRSDTSSVCHTYNTIGSFTITITAVNSCLPPSVSTVGPIIVEGPPVVNFTMGPNPACAPANINFTNTSTGALPFNDYTWHFGRFTGDSLYRTLPLNPPTQMYNKGVYTIMLVGRNNCGGDTAIQTLSVDTVPVPDIIVQPVEGCTPLTVITTNNTVDTCPAPKTHQWYIDGGICCLPFPNYTSYNIPNQVFTAPVGNNTQTHTIRYRVSNYCGVRDTIVPVLVHPEVVARFNMSPGFICEGGNVTFTDQSYGDSLSWSWDFGNGNTASTRGPHTQNYPTAGMYNVTLIVSGYCGIDTLVQVLDVRPYPIADFSPVPDSGCVPLAVNFTNNSTTGASYSWNFGAGASPTTGSGFTPPTVTYGSPGTSQIVLTVNLNGCIARDTQQVIIHPLPNPSFTVIPTDSCSPLTTNFGNTTPTTGGETWLWNFGDGTSSTLQNPPPHVYTNPGNTSLTRTITLIVTNSHGCVDSISRNVVIRPIPVAGFTAAIGACVGEVIAFTDTSIGVSNYLWDFGDSITSTQQNPTHGYGTSGTFTVTLIVSSNFGCTDTVTSMVDVDTIPAPNFLADTVCVGFTTSFTDLSAGSPTIWTWDFGDGNGSNLQNPTHNYAAAGVYNVKLIATNAIGCPDSITRPVLVNSIPVANFAAPPTCFGQPSTFQDQTSGVPIGWFWDLGDGTLDSTQNPTHVYQTVDTFDVTLIVFSGVGCSDTITLQHIVHPVPTAAFTADTVCFGNATSFASTSLGTPNTYVWNFGDGSVDNSNNPTPTHSYASDGTFTVTLIAGYAATGCTDTFSLPAIVNPTPVAAFSTGPVCLNEITVFTDQSTNNPNSWTWDFGDTTGSTQQNPSHLYAGSGSFNVGLTVQNAFGCIDSVRQTVTVNPLPVAGFAADTVCQNLSTSFQDLSSGAATWHWDFGDGDTSVLASPGHIYPAAGTYTVTQIVYTTFGCSDTASSTITVNPLPVANFGVSTACFGYASDFTDSSAGPPVSWNWDFGDATGTSIQQNPSYIYGDTGTFTSTLIVTNSFNCADTLSQPVTILPIPVAGFIAPVICARQPVQFTDTTLNNPNYWNWDFGDTTTPSLLQNPAHVYANGGIYPVTLIAGNSVGCFDTTTVSLTVNTVPAVSFTADTVCQFNTTTFTNTTTDPNSITFLWEFGDGNQSVVTSPTYMYQDSGWYDVELFVTNSFGCIDSLTIPVYVAPEPEALFSVDSVCVGETSLFLDQSSPFVTSWYWDFGDGTTSALPDPMHTFTTAGNHTVSLTVNTDYGCSGLIVQNTFAAPAPQISFTHSPLLCAGRQVDFTTSSFNNPVIWNWDFGDNSTSNLMDPSHIYADPGVYTVSLVAWNTIGCSDTATITFEVYENPVAEFAADTVCLGTPTGFVDLSTGTGLASWYWDFGNNSNTSYNQNPGYIFFTNPGTYTVTQVVTNTWGCADTTTQDILISDLPVASFTSNPAIPGAIPISSGYISFTNTSINAVSYLWTFGDGNSSTEVNPSHTYTETGNYCVTLIATAIGGCADTIAVCDVEIVPIAPIIPNTFTPNDDSFNDTFVILNVEDFPNNEIKIYNRWGNLIFETKEYKNEWSGINSFNGKLLPDGAYFYIFDPGPEWEEVVGEVVIMR